MYSYIYSTFILTSYHVEKVHCARIECGSFPVYDLTYILQVPLTMYNYVDDKSMLLICGAINTSKDI